MRNKRIAPGVLCLLLAAIVWVVFGQTLRYEFVNYDDDQYVYENPRVAQGLSIPGIHWAFTHVHADNWHPLTTISHMADCQLYGLQPWGHHMTNVALHAMAAVLLFLALRKLTGALWPSAVVATLFAIHPLRAGSVAWISERKDVLSGVLFMLILWSYARYAQSNRFSPGRYLLVVAFFALGLMCKPTLVTLPFILLLLDYWPLQRLATPSPLAGGRRGAKPFGLLLAEKIPFFVLSAASCLATLLAQERALIAMHQLTVADRVANAIVSYVIYIGQMIWPVRLAVVYPYPAGGWSLVQTLLALLVLLLLTALFFAWRRKHPFLLVGWLWFLGMLVPMIGLVQVGIQARADRYTYLAQIGLSILVVWGAMGLFAKWHRGREAAIVIVVFVVTGLMAGAYFQTSFWQNSETLWNRALVNTSNNHIARNNLGYALMKQEGRLDEAAVHLRKALEIYPDYPRAHYNLGYVLASKGQWADAIPSFRAALRVQPNYPEAHSNLAVSLSKLERTDEALVELREAVRLNHDYRDAHYNLAILLLQLGQRDEAADHFREALRLKPDDTAVRQQLHQLEVNR